MNLKDLDFARYLRDYQKVTDILAASKQALPDVSPQMKEYLRFVEFENTCLQNRSMKKIDENQIRQLFTQIEGFEASLDPSSLAIIDTTCLKLYLCQFVFKFEENDIEEKVKQALNKLPRVKQLIQIEEGRFLTETPYRAKCYLEAFLKRILMPDIRIQSQVYLDELDEWFDLFELARRKEIDTNTYKQFSGFRKVDKNLVLIAINKQIQILNKMPSATNIQIITRMLQFFTKNYRDLFGIDLVVTLLYNICKNALPFLGAAAQVEKDSLKKIIDIELKNGIFAYFKINLTIQTWDHLIIACLSFMQIQIDAKIDKYMNGGGNSAPNQENDGDGDKNGIPGDVYDSLYLFACVNYTQVRNKSKIIMRTILSYRAPSLANLIGLKIKRENFPFEFMQFMMSTPFDDNILGLKMSVQLYLREEYSKLYQLIQSLTQSESLQSHPLYPNLLALSSVFTGLNLGKNEEGLALAKLNLSNYLEQIKSEEVQKRILLQETLLAHVGFSYYNIYRNSKYELDKDVYLSKAIEYFEKSYERNPRNYLVCQALAKAYANSLNLDKALQFALQSCALSKSSQYAFILLALIYSARGELKKCQLLISGLLAENQKEPIFHILMAFIETEKYLSSQENHPDFRVADNFGSGIKSFLKLESQKSKQFSQIILNMVHACQVILKKDASKQELDKEFYKNKDYIVPLRDLHSQEIPPRIYLDYKNTLSYFIDILFHLEYYESIDDMSNLLNDGNKKNSTEAEYYKALLSERRGFTEIAIAKYEEILKSDFYHLKTMQNLALLYLSNKNDDNRRIDRAVELLIAGSKFHETSEIWYYSFILLKLLGMGLKYLWIWLIPSASKQLSKIESLSSQGSRKKQKTGNLFI